MFRYDSRLIQCLPPKKPDEIAGLLGIPTNPDQFSSLRDDSFFRSLRQFPVLDLPMNVGNVWLAEFPIGQWIEIFISLGT